MAVDLGQLAIRTAGMAAGFAATLFLPAGTLDWLAAWIFLGLFFGFSGVLSLWLLRFNPDLLTERLTGIGKPDQKAWDKIWIAITAVAFFAWLVVMALDAVRFRWSHMPLWLQGLGGAVLLSSFYLFFLTFRANPYLSPAVRLQKERAQKVVNTGPYHYVRHPMYAGFVPFALGTALLLGSWYGVLASVFLVAMVARRAVLEERVLRDGLEGYTAYISQVRYRLVPHLW